VVASKKSDQSIARAGFAEDVGAKRSYKSFTILPSKLRADHFNDNHDRAAVYSLASEMPELAGHSAFADDRFCFRRAEVMVRVDSFKLVGQEQPIKAYRSNTHQADVAAGFLRHVAALYLEVTDKLAECPDMREGLMVVAAEQPKSSLAAMDKNRAENERLDSGSPLNKAWVCKRYEVLGLSRTDIAVKLGCSKRLVDRYFQLLGLAPSIQVDVHEGRTKLMQALDNASKAGKGSATGPRAGINRKAIRRALAATTTRPLPNPKVKFTAEDAMLLAGAIVGEVELDDLPEHVAELVGWLDAPAGAGKFQAGETGPDGRKLPKRVDAPSQAGVA
jgi:AraC-like DNA-binding protein